MYSPLFLGVLYHLKDPLGALERLASLTRDRLILETHVDLIGSRRPACAFYPGAELHADASNWWGPNPPAVVAMLEAAGFSQVEVVFQTPLTRRALRTARAWIRREADRPRFREGRLVVHARK
jgi:tRNA (mo5U34)-methyltransferase